jgi:hypothetical protein
MVRDGLVSLDLGPETSAATSAATSAKHAAKAAT